MYRYMGGCQNYGPFLGTLKIGRIIIGTQKGPIILTSTHIYIYVIYQKSIKVNVSFFRDRGSGYTTEEEMAIPQIWGVHLGSQRHPFLFVISRHLQHQTCPETEGPQ